MVYLYAFYFRIGLLVLLFFSCEKSEHSVSHPNILLIMCDDLGWGDVGFNGNTNIKTPNLDTLASGGLILRRFYTASPVCSPTRASCLTGRNPFRLGIPNANAGHLRKEEITLPEILKDAGYINGHFGKWHLGTLTTKIRDANRGQPGDSTHYSIPSMHGYDAWFVTESKVPTYDPMRKPLRFDTTAGESLRYGWKAIENNSYTGYGTKYWKGKDIFETQNLEGDNSEIIMDRVIPFVKKAVEEHHPFFSTIWLHTPHLPVVSDQKHREMYAHFSQEEQLYFGTITAMDEQIGRLISHLKEMGVFENTLIWFCSDNGPERETPGSSGGFRERKRSLYEGGVRVPAFIHWPKNIISGSKTNFPMFTSDYLPTILDFLEIEIDTNKILDGISVRDALVSGLETRENPMGFLYPNKISWVTDRYKLISTDDGVSYELYDLINDPFEEKDIIQYNPEIEHEMKTALENWKQSVDLEKSIIN